MTRSLLRRVLVPVANLEDTEATCRALLPRIGEDIEEVILLHVIEQTEGFIDTASPEALEEEAEAMFAKAKELLRAVKGDATLETELRFGTDIPEEIVQSAVDHDVTAITFRPRSKGRLSRWFSKETEHRLIREAPCPVLTISDEGSADVREEPNGS